MVKNQYCLSVVMRQLVISPVILLFIVSKVAVCAYGWQSDNGQSDRLATVKIDQSAVYSEMSTDSRLVKVLSKGDKVAIHLEMTVSDGTWYSVSEAGVSKKLGYIRSEYLERDQPMSFSTWRLLPPPEPPAPPKEEVADSRKISLPRMPGTKWDVKEILDRFFRSRFGRSLPVSAFGQSRTHDRMGFDHRNAFDVPIHPDSVEGRSLIAFLRTQNIPFNAFRKAVRGAATGPHIHVGRPSPRK